MIPSRTWKSRCCRAECCVRVIDFSAMNWRRGVHRDGDRFERALQVGDRHPELLRFLVAQGGRQFGAGQGGVGRELDRGRIVLQRGAALKEAIDPDR